MSKQKINIPTTSSPSIFNLEDSDVMVSHITHLNNLVQKTSEEIEKLNKRMVTYATGNLSKTLQTFTDAFVNASRQERIKWKNLSNEELRLFLQTQSSFAGTVKKLRKEEQSHANHAIKAIKSQGIIISNKLTFALILYFEITTCATIYLLAKLFGL